jgi:hypothetical protein
VVPALAAAHELLVPPRETLVIPEGSKPTFVRDFTVAKHMATLTSSGRW